MYRTTTLEKRTVLMSPLMANEDLPEDSNESLNSDSEDKQRLRKSELTKQVLDKAQYLKVLNSKKRVKKNQQMAQAIVKSLAKEAQGDNEPQ